VENKEAGTMIRNLSTAIWWIRRDLRLSDNQALAAALTHSEQVVPVFILDPGLLNSAYNSQVREAFLVAGLRLLEAELRQRGSGLIIRQGDPLDALRLLRDETGAAAIFAEADFSPYARRRDARIGQTLPLTLTPGVTVQAPEKLHKPDGAPYTVFTPFSRMSRSLPFPGCPIPAPEWLPALPAVTSLGIPPTPSHPADSLFTAGEVEAQRRLDAFAAETINHYAVGRDRLDLDGTSGLSPYLRLGMLSARQAAWAAREAEALADNPVARKGAEIWLNELIWREFYTAMLYYFPHVRRTAFRPALRNIPWQNDPQAFAAWTEGQTGYPVVDAAMRQLNAIGWMHNRARMIAASFLTKDLLIDWRLGERCFMQRLLDGDPAANNGGWQWIAGTGTDAAPYFRVFNPSLQGKKFDPHGVYVRRWVPELAAVPQAYIHKPWDMPSEVQRQLGVVIGKDYPAPMVDHAFARQRVLAAYRMPFILHA